MTSDVRSRRARRSGAAGLQAERLALLWLSAKGYRLLARRFGGKGGEIDLILRRGRLVIFVEVKRRGTMEEALAAISPGKQRFIAARVRQWLAQNPWAMDHDLRADAVFLAPWRLPNHVPGVFALSL
ncbi:MAG: YraN family protein [Bosea sp. (in: a-proteobacteria)]